MKTTKYRRKKEKFSLLDQFPCEDAWLEKGQPFLTVVLLLAAVFVVETMDTDNSVGFSLIEDDVLAQNFVLPNSLSGHFSNTGTEEICSSPDIIKCKNCKEALECMDGCHTDYNSCLDEFNFNLMVQACKNACSNKPTLKEYDACWNACFSFYWELIQEPFQECFNKLQSCITDCGNQYCPQWVDQIPSHQF